jgi:hypothetical protein
MTERTHHPTLSPSSIPGLLQCSHYVSSNDNSEEATRGNELHALTASMVLGTERPACPNLEDGDESDCKWAAELIKGWCDVSFPGEPILNEVRIEVVNPSTGEIITYGFADFVCGAGVIDLKSCFDFKPSEHHFRPQLKVYALGRMQALKVDSIKCVEIYIKPNEFDEYITSWQDASANMQCAIQRREDIAAPYQICDHCGTCGNLKTCPAVNSMVKSVALRYGGMGDDIESILIADQLQDAAVMGKAMMFFKKVLEPWGKKIMEAGKEMIKTQAIPYWKSTEQNGRKSVTDAGRAFAVLNHKYPALTEPEFLACISVSLDKTADKLKELTGMPKAAAARDIESTLREHKLISDADSFQKLTMVKEIEQK